MGKGEQREYGQLNPRLQAVLEERKLLSSHS